MTQKSEIEERLRLESEIARRLLEADENTPANDDHSHHHGDDPNVHLEEWTYAELMPLLMDRIDFTGAFYNN